MRAPLVIGFVSLRVIAERARPAWLSWVCSFRRVYQWWAHQDSNLEPTDYESVALTG